MQTTWQTYIVGGAVRDELLGIPVHELDHVVVGAAPDDLLALGYLQVGKDFPVFLHPNTKEEYALARTERKTAPGYRGFQVHAATDVTLEQDLLRRDLTINAIAKNTDGQLIDPYHGQADINNRCLRHVSSAFSEDPLRVLRLARFHAHLYHLGFTIAPTTLALARDIVANGELHTIAKERLWTETYKALQTPSPWVYFATLQDMGAWQALAPELTRLWFQKGVRQGVQKGLKQGAIQGQPQANNLGISLLKSISGQTDQAEERLAMLLHTFNKPQIEALSQSLRMPNSVLTLCVQLSKHHRQILNYAQLSAPQRHRLLVLCDSIKNPSTLKRLTYLCSVLHSHGQLQLQGMDLYSELWGIIAQDIAKVQAITSAPYLAQGISGKALGEAIKAGQIEALN